MAKVKSIATKFNSYFGPMGTAAMRLVIMESPYWGATPEERLDNLKYAQRCLKDCLNRGEAPIASHLLLTQVLADSIPEERQLGIEAGLAWMRVAEASVIYTDHGISEGMRKGIEAARFAGIPTEMRTLK